MPRRLGRPATPDAPEVTLDLEARNAPGADQRTAGEPAAARRRVSGCASPAPGCQVEAGSASSAPGGSQGAGATQDEIRSQLISRPEAQVGRVPFLRVMRDKRGYETTYLLHWFREGTRQRSRVLYVFRTPGGVRVGRTPLDGDVLRQIETRYPDIAFDWDEVRQNQQIIESAPDLRRRRPKREEPEVVQPVPERIAPVEAPSEPPAAAGQRPAIPVALVGSTPDEQIAFLADWYPQIRERIAMRTAEPGRRDALMALAERLNPAAWTDADQITSGLQHATEAFERLSRVLGRRRRRARKRQPLPDRDSVAPGPEPPPPDPNDSGS